MTTIELQTETLTLETRFEIARGEQHTAEVVYLRMTDEAGQIGFGAAAPAEYYNESVSTVTTTINNSRSLIETKARSDSPASSITKLAEKLPSHGAALAAIDIALLDLWAKCLDSPIYQLWGYNPARAPQTSYTIGLASPPRMAEQAAKAVADEFKYIKIKLNGESDKERLQTIHDRVPEAVFRVDMNEAWTSAEAIDALEWLPAYNVELIEQPVARDNLRGLREVTEASPVPVIADESCVVPADIPAVEDAVDGINIKFMKCGGPHKAKQMMNTARSHGLDVMLGCMVESSASIAPAWHLAPAVDYVDLDGSLLLADDGFRGLQYTGGSCKLAQSGHGTGVQQKKTLGWEK